MIDVDIESIPEYFRFCLNEKCPVASKCLHHEAGVLVMKKGKKSMYVFNPMLMADRDENCEDFVTARIINYATGLIKFLNKIPMGDFDKVKNTLISAIGSERQFYRVRKGEVYLSPEKVQKIKEEVANSGCEIPLFFDENVYKYAFK